MKVRWLGKTEALILTNDKIYDVISIERGWYRVIDGSGEDYLYPPEVFEIVEEDNKIKKSYGSITWAYSKEGRDWIYNQCYYVG